MWKYRDVAFLMLFAFVSVDTKADDVNSQRLVEALIERLASGNPVPDVTGRVAEYPANFDENRHAQVFTAYRQLDALGVAAFPYLIQHLDDDRYACTADGGPKDQNFSVGALCYHIIELQIQPDKGWTAGEGDPRFRARRPHYPTHMQLRDKNAANAWWATHRTKTIRELQLIAVDWIISEEAKSPEEYPDAEKTALRERQIILRASDKPFPSSVPWFK